MAQSMRDQRIEDELLANRPPATVVQDNQFEMR
jgi:hypothetical protein